MVYIGCVNDYTSAHTDEWSLKTDMEEKLVKKNVTVKDIARETGLSVATVSRVINKSGYYDKATAEKVEKVIERLDYRPNRAAKNLKCSKTKNLLLIVPDIENPFYAKMVTEIQKRVRMEDYTLTMYNTNENLKEELRAIQLGREILADGIIFASVSSHDAILTELKKFGKPVVMVNSYDKCPFDSVHGKRNYGTYLSTKYLIEQGHTRIGFAGGTKDTVIAESRAKGYLTALKEAGMESSEELMFEMGFSSEAGRKAGRYFSTLKPMPSAICCANDMIALGVINVLGMLGVKVPEQVSVTGMDNLMYADICNPGLTSVTNDSTEFAQKAMDALFERLKGGYEGEAREYVIDHRMIVRGSTCPHRIEER